MSLAVEQDSIWTQDRLASRMNFLAMAKLTEAPALVRSSALQFPGMLQYPGTQTQTEAPRKKVETVVIFPNDPEIHKT